VRVMGFLLLLGSVASVGFLGWGCVNRETCGGGGGEDLAVYFIRPVSDMRCDLWGG